MTRIFLLAALLGVGVGTAMVYAGVLAAGIFIPGVILIGVGLVLAAAAGIIELLPHRAPLHDEAGGDA
jgi:hypothetical protein